ncbi:MAG: ATP phosphoribosyltransferase regulatory subunit, partial [Phycisphaerales bacterium JB061]
MSKTGSNKIPPPKGTRDLYPQDLLRQRYITEAWRRVSIRHGFEEIAGPTFEMLDLYKKKSGEGIVSELFSFTRAGGDDDYALRPEFTPTLARMYAEHAKQLPSPCKWFTAGPYFRAEKPQRGRLREFLQWNCDVMGGESDQQKMKFDLELIVCL